MPETTDVVREPRFWKITVNPTECPAGAWDLFRSTGRAMLGLPGDEGETNYAVRNLQRLAIGDWIVAYTPQEGAYTVGGVGQVVSGYACEEGPFEHPWNGPVRRSVGVAWQAGPCSIADLVKDGRFRKGKIPRVLDEITGDEFACVRERVVAAAGVDEVPSAPLAEPIAWHEPAAPLTMDNLAAVSEPDIRLPEAEDATEVRARSSPVVLDPAQEQPPLPQFFLDWIREEKLLGPDLPAGTTLDPLAERSGPGSARNETAVDEELTQILKEAGVAIRQSREANLLAGFAVDDDDENLLDFGLPGACEGDPLTGEPMPFGKAPAPSEVRVGATGWTGLFRQEVESGRTCSLLLRGPQYSFLNMTPAGTPLRGLPLFALFAIGAVSAPGKEAFRSGAHFIFRGRRESGDYEVEVRPRRVRPVFREPAELAH
jgi:hypothetical protein